MTRREIIERILLTIAIAAFACAFGYLVGEAWDYDQEAHSRDAFGDSYEYQGE